MKIATGNMVNIPYTPPRTQLSVIELEDSVATSGQPVPDKYIEVSTVSVKDWNAPIDDGTITFDDQVFK